MRMQTTAEYEDKDPFALPPGFEEYERPKAVKGRHRSLGQWMSDAIERAAWVTLHVAVVLSIIAFWVLLVMGAATLAMAVIGGAA